MVKLNEENVCYKKNKKNIWCGSTLQQLQGLREV